MLSLLTFDDDVPLTLQPCHLDILVVSGAMVVAHAQHMKLMRY